MKISIKHNFDIRRILITVVICFGIASSLYAQKNRYGMKLKEENGKYHLVDEKRYSILLKDDFANLPDDMSSTQNTNNQIIYQFSN